MRQRSKSALHGRTLLILVSIGLWLASAPATAAPKAELWERWTAHDPASAAQVDHSAWDRFLREHVSTDGNGVNRIAYGDVSAADRQALDAYLAGLSRVPVSGLSRPRQLAFWVNLYNALTVAVVLDAYPVASIRDIDISPGLFADGPWGKKLVTVEGEPVSLDDIEHRILRPIWRDPRIHYAVNCASIGCPNLRPMAMTAATAEAYLDAGAHDYVNNPRGASAADGRLVVSSLYDWYRADFGGDEAGVIGHLRRYASPPLATALDGLTSIADDRYDWSLNDAD
jgi:hypothetical protein